MIETTKQMMEKFVQLYQDKNKKNSKNETRKLMNSPKRISSLIIPNSSKLPL